MFFHRTNTCLSFSVYCSSGSLRNSVVLGGVVGGEASLCSLRFEEIGEVAAVVLSTAVRPKALDAYFVLSFGPSSERLVSLESLALIECSECGRR